MMDMSRVRAKHALLMSAVLLVVAVQGCKKKAAADDDTGSDAKPVVTVQAEKVAMGSITETVQADSVLQPLAQAAVVPKISSPVKKFYVQRGAKVRAGQVLAVLENADLAASVVDTRGSLTQAQAAYNTATKATVPEDLTTAEANVEQTKAALEVQRQQTESRANLLAEGAIPKRDYDTAKAALVQAQGAYDTAVQHLSGLKRASSQATVLNAQGGLESARGKYENAGAQLSYATIRSPLSGVVTDRPLFVGEMAQAGTPLLTVMDISSVLAKVHLPEEQAVRLKVGDKAHAQVQGEDDTADGAVSLVSPAADAGTTTIEVWVKIPNRDAHLRPGTPVHVSIEERTLDNITTVPNESIITTKTGGTAVMVIGSDNVAHERDVKLGVTDGKDTQVLEGVHVGEMVVTTGSQSLEDGTAVKVGAADEDEDKKGGGDSGDKAGADDKAAKSGPDEGGDAAAAKGGSDAGAAQNGDAANASGNAGKGSGAAGKGSSNANGSGTSSAGHGAGNASAGGKS